MPYYGQYRGDYKTYGYAQGDPGFLSSLWKGVKKIAAPVIGGLIGGPVGAALGSGIGGVGTPPIVAQSKPTPRLQIQASPFHVRATSYGPTVPPPPGGVMMGRTAIPAVAAQAGCAPSGYHLAKDGSGRFVRNRRMNPANPKALRRAIRRTDGFVKLAKRALKGTGYAVRRA